MLSKKNNIMKKGEIFIVAINSQYWPILHGFEKWMQYSPEKKQLFIQEGHSQIEDHIKNRQGNDVCICCPTSRDGIPMLSITKVADPVNIPTYLIKVEDEITVEHWLKTIDIELMDQRLYNILHCNFSKEPVKHITERQFMRIRNAGPKSWQQFVKFRGF